MANTRTQIAAALFQPVPGGYVYREPYRWPFGQAPHYLVNDEQKAALLAIIVPKRPVLWQVVLWSALCLIVAVTCVGLWLYTGHDTPTALDTLAVVVLTVAVGLPTAAVRASTAEALAYISAVRSSTAAAGSITAEM